MIPFRQIQARSNPREVNSSVNIDGCNATSDCVSRIEHIEVTTVFDYSLRGAIMLYIDSPMGTRSELLTRRNLDTARNSRHTWKMMSVQHWGEDPVGTWVLTMSLQYDWAEHGMIIKNIYFNVSFTLSLDAINIFFVILTKCIGTVI